MPLAERPFTLFLLLKTRPAWLALPRDERNRIAATALSGALNGQEASLRHFDAEAFCARCTDLAMLTVDDPRVAYRVIERLRDTPLFAVPYFEMVEIIPAIEDGFRAFEAEEAA